MKEPRRHPAYLILLATCCLGTVPLAFTGRESVDFLGLPVWLWSSIAFTVAMSCVTAWGVICLWKDDDGD